VKKSGDNRGSGMGVTHTARIAQTRNRDKAVGPSTSGLDGWRCEKGVGAGISGFRGSAIANAKHQSTSGLDGWRCEKGVGPGISGFRGSAIANAKHQTHKIGSEIPGISGFRVSAIANAKHIRSAAKSPISYDLYSKLYTVSQYGR
jgi:hypothetical protein